MADTPDQLIKNLLATIEKATNKFNESLPQTQRQVFSKVIELSRELEITRGRIAPSVNNVRLIARIRKELENIIISKPYLKKLDEFVAAFDTVEEINGKYFSAINEKYKPTAVFREIKKQTIDETLSSLSESGIGENVTKKIRDILRTNITSGGKFEDYVEQMRQYITDTRAGDGALVKYAKQITTDSINQYNASYNQIATADLGLVWYKFVGSLLATSREWCKELIGAKNDCLPYIHKSQFSKIVSGDICGRQVAIYKKTGLPYGMIEGTTADNLVIRRGGYSCGHQFYPVSSAIVPQNLRDKFE